MGILSLEASYCGYYLLRYIFSMHVVNTKIIIWFVHYLLQIVLKELLENGFLHGDQVTVNGKTMAENLTHVPRLPELGKQVIFTTVKKTLSWLKYRVIMTYGQELASSLLYYPKMVGNHRQK